MKNARALVIGSTLAVFLHTLAPGLLAAQDSEDYAAREADAPAAAVFAGGQESGADFDAGAVLITVLIVTLVIVLVVVVAVVASESSSGDEAPEYTPPSMESGGAAVSTVCCLCWAEGNWRGRPCPACTGTGKWGNR